MKKALVTLVIVAFLTGCAAPGVLVKPEQTTCDAIGYYDQYVESARLALFGLQFIPGIANHIAMAATALLAIDIAMDEAQAQCNLAAQGKVASTKAAFDAVWVAIQEFNKAYGEIKAIVKAQK